MAFALLILEPVGQRRARPPEEGVARYDAMLAYSADLRARGLLTLSQSLKSESEAIRVSGRGVAASIVDGPYAEAKEMIGGFFLLSCESRDEALAIARDCPAAEWATIEIRELGPCIE